MTTSTKCRTVYIKVWRNGVESSFSLMIPEDYLMPGDEAKIVGISEVEELPSGTFFEVQAKESDDDK